MSEQIVGPFFIILVEHAADTMAALVMIFVLDIFEIMLQNFLRKTLKSIFFLTNAQCFFYVGCLHDLSKKIIVPKKKSFFLRVQALNLNFGEKSL